MHGSRALTDTTREKSYDRRRARESLRDVRSRGGLAEEATAEGAERALAMMPIACLRLAAARSVSGGTSMSET